MALSSHKSLAASARHCQQTCLDAQLLLHSLRQCLFVQYAFGTQAAFAQRCSLRARYGSEQSFQPAVDQNLGNRRSIG